MWSLLLPVWTFGLLGVGLTAPVSGRSNAHLSTDVSAAEFRALPGDIFVNFYTPYCGRCARLTPKWDAAVKQVETRSHMKWVSVDCVLDGDLCAEENVLAYPDLRVYRDGKRIYDLDNPDASEEELKAFGEAFGERGDDVLSRGVEKDTSEVHQDAKSSGSLAMQEFYEHGRDIAGAGEAVVAVAAELMGPSSEASDPGSEASDPGSEASDPGSETEQATTQRTDEAKSKGSLETQRKSGFSIVALKPFCEECDFLKELHAAGESPTADWGVVDCEAHSDICFVENVGQAKSMRISEMNEWYTYHFMG